MSILLTPLVCTEPAIEHVGSMEPGALCNTIFVASSLLRGSEWQPKSRPPPNPRGPHEKRDPGPHFHYDFGDPSMNLGTLSKIPCPGRFLENQWLPLEFLGVNIAHNARESLWLARNSP